jgi:alkylation response protein AidB-like acyl-CoA dehydrogenase
LQGDKCAVLNGAAADYLIVTARTAGERCDAEGISLFLVAADAAGVSRQSYPMVDGSRGADIGFRDVQLQPAALLGPLHGALPLVEDVVAEAIIAMGAEAVGAMDALLEQTVEYTKTREQFGQPIGNFQALQHRMADMYLHCQATRSLMYYAAIARAEDRPDKLKAASALKVKLGEAGRYVSQQAVQLHGGIGMTDELGVSHYLKRLLLLNTLFGDSEHHLDKYLEG